MTSGTDGVFDVSKTLAEMSDADFNKTIAIAKVLRGTPKRKYERKATPSIPDQSDDPGYPPPRRTRRPTPQPPMDFSPAPDAVVKMPETE